MYGYCRFEMKQNSSRLTIVHRFFLIVFSPVFRGSLTYGVSKDLWMRLYSYLSIVYRFTYRVPSWTLNLNLFPGSGPYSWFKKCDKNIHSRTIIEISFISSPFRGHGQEISEKVATRAHCTDRHSRSRLSRILRKQQQKIKEAWSCVAACRFRRAEARHGQSRKKICET